VIIKVRPADIGKVMKFNKESLPVEDRDWDGEIGMVRLVRIRPKRLKSSVLTSVSIAILMAILTEWVQR
jgi:hypothetical protein